MVRDLQREYDHARDNYRRAVRRYDNLPKEVPHRYQELANRAQVAELDEGAFCDSLHQSLSACYGSLMEPAIQVQGIH